MMPKGIYVRKFTGNMGRYKRTPEMRRKMSDLRISLHKNNPDIARKQSKTMKMKFRNHPEKSLVGDMNGMYGKRQLMLGMLEGSIIRSTIPACNVGNVHLLNTPEANKKKSETRLRMIASGEIVFPTGSTHRLFGKNRSKSTKKKISIANTGRRYPDSVNKKKSHPGESNPFYGKVHDDITFKRIMKAVRKRPTKFELAVQRYLDQNHPGEWKYCGDGSVVMNGGCPDFINCNGKKRVVLANSVYWHMTKKGLTRKESEKLDSRRYKELGFDVWFIWDDEFKILERRF